MPKNRAIADRRLKLRARAAIISSIRQFFQNGGYLEVETPHRLPVLIPEAHIDAVDSDGWFLHPSPELCMKRLLAAGYDNIFQICRCWRGSERGAQHLPEFTMLEWYRSGSDYLDLMLECEELLRHIAATALNASRFLFRGEEIDLAVQWDRITVKQAFLRYTDISMEEAVDRDIFDILMVEAIEPNLGRKRPQFIMNYPASKGSLAKPNDIDPTIVERFELYIGGVELANAFSELNDPLVQRERFRKELINRSVPHVMPEKFLSELEFMPPTAGIAMGIDRLVMVMLNAASIDEIVTFTPEDL